MPEHPVFIKTIVTMDMAERIAADYGVEKANVLTRFKYIGEVIGRMEAEGHEADYICAFEESYGYLTVPYVRDKDAVNAAFMICELFMFYKICHISLGEKSVEIYNTYGYCLNTVYSCEFPGRSGMKKMQSIMANFHKGLNEIAGMKVVRTEDYLPGPNDLPKSDVLKLFTESDSVFVRSSGTEPKLKRYFTVTAANKAV